MVVGRSVIVTVECDGAHALKVMGVHIFGSLRDGMWVGDIELFCSTTRTIAPPVVPRVMRQWSVARAVNIVLRCAMEEVQPLAQRHVAPAPGLVMPRALVRYVVAGAVHASLRIRHHRRWLLMKG